MNSIQISGGVDSMALLWLLKSKWPESVVMWANSGAAYPETEERMARIAKMVPHFRVVHSSQIKVVAEHGLPVDVIPVKFTVQGDAIFGLQPDRYQSYVDCCRRVLWEPMHRACVAMGIDTVYRGQRGDDERKAPISSGFIDQYGIKYLFPLERWTRAEVFKYVRAQCPDLLPPYYDAGEVSSRDCWSCTAYRNDNVQRVKALPPGQREYVEGRLAVWKQHVMEEMAYG